MILHINSSGSQGNSYYFDDGKEILLLEAGINYVDILRSIDYRMDKVVGCLVSHDHKSDHSKCVDDMSNRGIEIFSTEHLANNHPQANVTVLKEKKLYAIGSYHVMPFAVEHDIPDFGFIIKHPDMGRMLFATDCAYIPTVFKGVDNFLIEANYSDEKLLLSDTDNAQKKRIMKSHMSLEYTVDYLRSAGAENAKNIILIHLSSRHSDPLKFLDRIEGEFGVPTFIAHKNTTIYL